MLFLGQINYDNDDDDDQTKQILFKSCLLMD